MQRAPNTCYDLLNTPLTFILNKEGTLLQVSRSEDSAVRQWIGQSLKQNLCALHPQWDTILSEGWLDANRRYFLPWADCEPQPIGTALEVFILNGTAIVTCLPTLAPIEALRESGAQELPPSPEIAGQLFVQLQRTQNRLDSYLKHFPGVFFSQRPDLSFSFIAQNFEDLFGDPIKPLMRHGRKFLSLIVPEDREPFLRELEAKSSEQGSFTLTYRIQNPKTQKIIYMMDVRTAQRSAEGLLIGYDGVWLDITRQSIAEDRLMQSAWRESLSVLTSGLIHDFSNIMAGIYSISELYGSQMEPEHPWLSGMQQIKQSAREAQKMVRRIIDLSRDVKGQNNYFNLVELIQGQLDLLKIILPKQTQIIFEAQEKELPVYLDDVRLRQTLLNFAMNSRDALEGAHGKIHITVRHVKQNEPLLALMSDVEHPLAHRAKAEIYFRDNGSGIPEKYLSKIFDPFFTTKASGQGSGLGLYNAKLFIENLGGKVAVQSQQDAGTCLALCIPLATFNELEESYARTPIALKIQERSRLLVYGQENTHDCTLIEELKTGGWEIICFQNQEKMLEYVRTDELAPKHTLLIDVGEDDTLAVLSHQLKATLPGVKIAVQTPLHRCLILGSPTPLILERDLPPREAIQKLEEWISHD